MTSKMLSEGKDSTTEADGEKKKNKEKMKNDDDVNTEHADGDDEEYLSLLEQTAIRTGFIKSFDTQTKNLLCDIGVIHGFLAQICVVSKKTRE